MRKEGGHRNPEIGHKGVIDVVWLTILSGIAHIQSLWGNYKFLHTLCKLSLHKDRQIMLNLATPQENR